MRSPWLIGFLLLGLPVLGAEPQPPAPDSAGTDASSADGAPAAAAATPAANERGALLPNEPSLDRELARAFPSDEVVWLESASDKALAVYRPSVRGAAKGVFVLVLPEGKPPDTYSVIGTLRLSLPRQSWATLVLRLPEQPTAALPSRNRSRDGDPLAADATPAETTPADGAAPTSASENVAVADATAAAPNVIDISPKVRARLDAALLAAKARAGGGPVVMLGEGEAAAWLVWAQGDGLGASALIAVNLDGDEPLIEAKRPGIHLESVSGPALLLIESPRDWSPNDTIAADTELHRLPPGHPAGVRIERVLRGWLKRRLG